LEYDTSSSKRYRIEPLFIDLPAMTYRSKLGTWWRHYTKSFSNPTCGWCRVIFRKYDVTLSVRTSTKKTSYQPYIQGVSEGIVNILGGGSMDYSE